MNFLAELSSVLVVLANHMQNILETIAVPLSITCRSSMQLPTIKKKRKEKKKRKTKPNIALLLKRVSSHIFLHFKLQLILRPCTVGQRSEQKLPLLISTAEAAN